MFYFALRNNATSGKISASSGANFSIRVINNPVDKIQILLFEKVKEMRIVVASEWIELEQLLNKRKKAEKTTDTHIWICYLVFVTGLQFLMFLILWIVVYCCFCWKKNASLWYLIFFIGEFLKRPLFYSSFQWCFLTI